MRLVRARRRLARSIGAALVAVAIAACGPGDAKVGEGVLDGDAWVATVHQFQAFDDRVCVAVRFERGDPVSSGCGFNNPGANAMEIDSSGFIFAQTWNAAATHARFEPAGGAPVEVGVFSGEPASHSGWVVLHAAVPAGNPGGLPFRIVFLDAAGTQVDVVSN